MEGRIMPKEGFESLTIHTTTYKHFEKIFDENKDTLHLLGINSFSGFVTTFLEELIGNDHTFNMVVGQMIKTHTTRLKELMRKPNEH